MSSWYTGSCIMFHNSTSFFLNFLSHIFQLLYYPSLIFYESKHSIWTTFHSATLHLPLLLLMKPLSLFFMLLYLFLFPPVHFYTSPCAHISLLICLLHLLIPPQCMSFASPISFLSSHLVACT